MKTQALIQIEETSFTLVVNTVIFLVTIVKIIYLTHMRMTFLAILIQRTLSETMGVQLSLSLKTLEKLYRCIKQLGGGYSNTTK